jgi:hypothetical protein
MVPVPERCMCGLAQPWLPGRTPFSWLCWVRQVPGRLLNWALWGAAPHCLMAPQPQLCILRRGARKSILLKVNLWFRCWVCPPHGGIVQVGPGDSAEGRAGVIVPGRPCPLSWPQCVCLQNGVGGIGKVRAAGEQFLATLIPTDPVAQRLCCATHRTPISLWDGIVRSICGISMILRIHRASCARGDDVVFGVMVTRGLLDHTTHLGHIHSQDGCVGACREGPRPKEISKRKYS